MSRPNRPAGGRSGWLLDLGTLPVACAVVTAIQALSMLLVVVGNVTDSDTNGAFVANVLKMDTTNVRQPEGVGLDPGVMGRAVDSPTLHVAAYVRIIASMGVADMIRSSATAARG